MIDIRYPALVNGMALDKTISASAQSAGITYTLLGNSEPLYLPKEGPLVQLLSGAYEDITGKECDIYAMGGGTYARQMFGNGVAFGAGFHDEESNAHNCNESLDLENFKLHAQICLEAMYRLFTAD